jgi:site-specific DNA recombinase
MRKAIGYIRVSTDKQLDGVSLDDQKTRIERYCAGRYELAEIFSDEGLSAKRADNRPGLQNAITQAMGSEGVLVFFDLFRFSRTLYDAIGIVTRLHKGGADFASLAEGNYIDTTTASGNLFFNMMMSFGQFQREKASEHGKMTAIYKQKRQERYGRYAPYGYDLHQDGVRLVNNSHEQDILRWILTSKSNGMTANAIANRLNCLKTPSKTGKRWHTKVVAQICARHTKETNNGKAQPQTGAV